MFLHARALSDNAFFEIKVVDLEMIEIHQVVKDNRNLNAAKSEPSDEYHDSEKPGSMTKESLDRTKRELANNCMKVVGIVFRTLYLSSLTPLTSGPCMITTTGSGTTQAFAGNEVASNNELQRLRFAILTKDRLIRDMAQGKGEYLTAMAYLHGCPIKVHDTYAAMAQNNFDQILSGFETDAGSMLANLDAQIAQEQVLVERCTRRI